MARRGGSILVRVTTANAASLRMAREGPARFARCETSMTRTPRNRKAGAMSHAHLACRQRFLNPQQLAGAWPRHLENAMQGSAADSAHRRTFTDFPRDRALQGLVDACLRVGKYQPGELLRWLVNGVLADFGLPKEAPAPDDVRDWLRAAAGAYADLVARFPFVDVLGHVYQSIGSRGHRGALGQFFTPPSVSTLIVLVGAADRPADGRLLRACEPACGSGALVLAFMQAQTDARGPGALRSWSITAIDLDVLCARMCAAQVLANLLLHRLELGELVVYRGNALGPRSGLSVVIHTTVADLTPSVAGTSPEPSGRASCRGRGTRWSGGSRGM